jgi:hypothetical protein
MKFRVIHHVDRATIDGMYAGYTPVFILSTGRSGSKFAARLLDLSSNVSAYHEPRPTLEYFSNYAYHHQDVTEVLTRMIDAARMESILENFIKDKIYVESNQCLTFFAPFIARLFEKSKFAHVVRHPGDFVRSALRKGWHKNDSIWESGRLKKADESQWAEMDQIERLSWLWQATNSYIEEFKKSILFRRTLSFKFEDLVQDPGNVKTLLEFIGSENIDKRKIEEVQKSKINELHIKPWEPPTMKKVMDFPHYKDWEPGMQDKLKKYCSELAGIYGYRL